MLQSRRDTRSVLNQGRTPQLRVLPILYCFGIATTLPVLYYYIFWASGPFPPTTSTFSNTIATGSWYALSNTSQTPSGNGRRHTERSNPWDSRYFVRDAPRDRFQDNLQKSEFYITSWANAGFTNQFISYVNMIYLGILSDRIPIIPPFAPDHHISSSAGPLPFGEIFNLTELRNSLRKPVLEWSQVKSLPPRLSLETPSSTEQIGCWSIRPAKQKDPILAQNLLSHLGLDVSYTRVPAYIRDDPILAANAHVALLPLAEKIYPLDPRAHVEDTILMAASPSGSKLSPNHHMSCFDFLYYASVGTQPYEWKSSWSPAWRFVGRHLPFTTSVFHLAEEYIRRALQVTTDELPPFITVHARRGDFAHQCFDVPSQCLASLSAYERRVKEMQGAIFVKKGIKVTEVLITSDEVDPSFWAEVRDIGWRYIDHSAEQTLKRYGEWYVPIIDIVSQSLGVGFVGSIDSTVSIVTAHRVEDWNDGVTGMVNWGGRD